MSNIKNDCQRLVCTHTFHNSCIEEWFESQLQKKLPNPTCPECRTFITSKKRIQKIVKNYTRSISLCLMCEYLLDDSVEIIMSIINKSIHVLNLGYNEIGDNGAEVLAKNTTLLLLVLESNQITDIGAIYLSKNTVLLTLNLQDNHITDVGAEALAKNTGLLSLNLQSNQITNAGAEALAKNTNLSTLNLRNNMIGDSGAEALAKNTKLVDLDLSNQRFA